jgi:16S rRNA (cytosine967-C5)-methyltransferase
MKSIHKPSPVSRNARTWALFKLIQVEEGGAWANLSRAGLAELSPPDRALAVELLAGVTRRRATLDWYLNQHLKQPLESLTSPIRNNLRVALYQICFLSRIPASAAVNEAVKIAHQVGHPGVARLTNAILRNFLRRRDSLIFPTWEDHPQEHLQVAYSLPAWLASAWWENYGKDALALAQWSVSSPRLALRVNLLRTSREAFLNQLAQLGRHAEPSAVTAEGVRLQEGVEPGDLTGFEEGLFYIQDEAAMLVSRILDPQPRECILDIGAAPGGKTSHIAELTANQAEIWAIDRSEARLNRLKENFRRLGHADICVKVQDASDLSGLPMADRILLDAPCSGLGVLTRKPDLRWNQTPETLEGLAALQTALLDEALQHLKPGGTLVYSTCTIGKIENQDVVRSCIQRHPNIHPVDFRSALPAAWRADFEAELGAIQLRPDRHGVDGFFIAKLRRGMMVNESPPRA